MAKDCLYCGLQFPDTTKFCPNCGRLIESGFKIRPMQESELDRLRWEVKKKDELIRQLVLTRTLRGESSRAAAHSTARRGSAHVGCTTLGHSPRTHASATVQPAQRGFHHLAGDRARPARAAGAADAEPVTAGRTQPDADS